jgi:hypothetical protein
MFQHEMWVLQVCLVPSPFSHCPRVIPETMEHCFTSRTLLRDTYLKGHVLVALCGPSVAPWMMEDTAKSDVSRGLEDLLLRS